jgi:hypothetical protein
LTNKDKEKEGQLQVAQTSRQMNRLSRTSKLLYQGSKTPSVLMTSKAQITVTNGEKGDRIDEVALKKMIKFFLEKGLLKLSLHLIIFNDLLDLPETKERPTLGMFNNKYLVKRIGLFQNTLQHS